MAAIAEIVHPIETVLPVCLCPWLENPYRLVSLWDMQRFPAEYLNSAITILERIRCEWIHIPLPGDPVAAQMLGQNRIATPGERQHLEEHLRAVQELIKHGGLRTTAETINEFRTDLINYKMSHLSKMTAEQIVARVDEIQRTMQREMKTVLFFYVHGSTAADLYREPLTGWETVAVRWPKIADDITESSICFALDRFAAAIFHALLVAEFGVIQVADLLNASGDKPGWGSVQRLERILQKPYKERSTLEQQHSKLLQAIVPMIVAVKDSLRHKVMHVDNKLEWLNTNFTLEIAAEVISSTRGFMRRLAEDLPFASSASPAPVV
jgi:hypothetical protein